MIDCIYFSTDSDIDLVCPCCGREELDDDFMSRIDTARKLADLPFKINSGYRCQDYQDYLKSQGFETAEGLSPHVKGVAIDIHCSDPQKRWKILNSLKNAGLDRFGLAKTFIHVDNDPDRLFRRMWLYNRRK